uniref:Protein kinase domain-containing protein n=1 Tax=Macrostomum lignano TaxID=282301 RepID=A0A1I8IS45_9PLAT
MQGDPAEGTRSGGMPTRRGGGTKSGRCCSSRCRVWSRHCWHLAPPADEAHRTPTRGDAAEAAVEEAAMSAAACAAADDSSARCRPATTAAGGRWRRRLLARLVSTTTRVMRNRTATRAPDTMPTPITTDWLTTWRSRYTTEVELYLAGQYLCRYSSKRAHPLASLAVALHVPIVGQRGADLAPLSRLKQAAGAHEALAGEQQAWPAALSSEVEQRVWQVPHGIAGDVQPAQGGEASQGGEICVSCQSVVAQIQALHERRQGRGLVADFAEVGDRVSCQPQLVQAAVHADRQQLRQLGEAGAFAVDCESGRSHGLQTGAANRTSGRVPADQVGLIQAQDGSPGGLPEAGQAGPVVQGQRVSLGELPRVGVHRAEEAPRPAVAGHSAARVVNVHKRLEGVAKSLQLVDNCVSLSLGRANVGHGEAPEPPPSVALALNGSDIGGRPHPVEPVGDLGQAVATQVHILQADQPHQRHVHPLQAAAGDVQLLQTELALRHEPADEEPLQANIFGHVQLLQAGESFQVVGQVKLIELVSAQAEPTQLTQLAGVRSPRLGGRAVSDAVVRQVQLCQAGKQPAEVGQRQGSQASSGQAEAAHLGWRRQTGWQTNPPRDTDPEKNFSSVEFLMTFGLATCEWPIRHVIRGSHRLTWKPDTRVTPCSVELLDIQQVSPSDYGHPVENFSVVTDQVGKPQLLGIPSWSREHSVITATLSAPSKDEHQETMASDQRNDLPSLRSPRGLHYSQQCDVLKTQFEPMGHLLSCHRLRGGDTQRNRRFSIHSNNGNGVAKVTASADAAAGVSKDADSYAEKAKIDSEELVLRYLHLMNDDKAGRRRDASCRVSFRAESFDSQSSTKSERCQFVIDLVDNLPETFIDDDLPPASIRGRLTSWSSESTTKILWLRTMQSFLLRTEARRGE